MCIKMEFGVQYNGRIMGQTRGSSCKFPLHGGIKQDLIKEVTFGNLGDIGRILNLRGKEKSWFFSLVYDSFPIFLFPFYSH